LDIQADSSATYINSNHNSYPLVLNKLSGSSVLVKHNVVISHPNLDDLQVGDGSGHCGITVYTGTGSYGSVAFADGNSGTAQYSGLIEYYHNNNSMTLYTGGTARLRLNSSGRQTFNSSGTANAHATYVGEVGHSFKALAFEHTVGGGEVGTIVTGSSSTTYNTSSDYRLKENVDYTWDATTRLKQLKPARFNFKADADTTIDGFLAHEVSSIVPEAITGVKDEVYTEDDETNGDGKQGDPIYQGIDQSKLVPLLVKTIQELEARITTLEG
jgi:hypothetical protein